MTQDSKLFNKNNPNEVRFRGMMQSGQLVDERAQIVQSQVVVHKANASIRNRPTVPLYMHTEEGRPPPWHENILVETGAAIPPGMDTRYMLEDSRYLHEGIRTGAVDIEGESPLKSKSVAIAVNIAAVIVFVACAWVAGGDSGSAATAVPEPEAATQQEERVQHGTMEPEPVTTEAAEPAEAAEAPAEPSPEGEAEGPRQPAAEGPQDPGDSSPERVVPGDNETGLRGPDIYGGGVTEPPAPGP